MVPTNTRAQYISVTKQHQRTIHQWCQLILEYNTPGYNTSVVPIPDYNTSVIPTNSCTIHQCCQLQSTKYQWYQLQKKNIIQQYFQTVTLQAFACVASSQYRGGFTLPLHPVHPAGHGHWARFRAREALIKSSAMT